MVRWGWWCVKVYKVINILGYINIFFLNLGKKKSDINVIIIFKFYWLIIRNKCIEF